MKKFFLALIMVCTTIGVQAQFAIFDRLEDDRQVQTSPTQTVYGYVPTSSGWVRVTLQVTAVNGALYVVAFRPNQSQSNNFAIYGNDSGWNKCKERAQGVSAYSDGQTVANNFEYKATVIGLGTVYF